MMKYAAPLRQRLRHLTPPSERPPLFRHHGSRSASDITFGQRLAERAAATVGSWPFLIIQSGFLCLWLIYNTLQITRHFDPPPYILLNLLLSFQAAFTGPVLLIAANVGAIRDHRQYDRIEQLERKVDEKGDRTDEKMDALSKKLDVLLALEQQRKEGKDA